MTTRHPSRRQIQAEATRRDILVAARRLFAEHGYAATSMAAIAEAAGAAVQTVYDSVGPKRAVLLALNDLLDEEGGVAAMQQRFGETRDPRQLIGLVVELARQINDRCGDIVGTMDSAAAIEPDAAAALGDGHRRHRAGTARVAAGLAAMGALRPGLSTERAGQILGFMTWAQTFRLIVLDYGWTFDEAEAWLTETLATLLLREMD